VVKEAAEAMKVSPEALAKYKNLPRNIGGIFETLSPPPKD